MGDMIETQVFRLRLENLDNEAICTAAAVLEQGGLVAFPTETVYGLGANALDSTAVARIFTAKGRPASDPVIVHLYELLQLEQVAVDVPDLAYKLADRFWPGPLTLVLKRHSAVPSLVSAGMETVGVRMPNHPIPLALFRASKVPVAAPSANRFARPSATTAQHVLEDLNGRVEIILDGGPAMIGLESTILDVTRTPPAILRPGGISLETLQVIIPDVQVISRHLRPDEAGIEAPGMLYKHYSPRAELRLFRGKLEQVIPVMQSEAQRWASMSKQVGILCPAEESAHFKDLPVQLFSLGSGLSAISHNLFNGMRELDRAGMDVILVHGFAAEGLGAALWDRLLRAAEGQVIECG